MPSIRYMAISAIGATLLSAGAIGVAGATSVQGSSSTKPDKTLVRSIKQDRLLAASEVLHTTATNIKSDRKAKTLDKLIVSSGLTKKEFNTQVRGIVMKDLESKGYSKDQIIIALQRMRLNHYRREDRLEHKQG